MGKKAKARREHKASAATRTAFARNRPSPSQLMRDPRTYLTGGGQLIVLSPGGGMLLGDEARDDFWNEVCESLRHDNAAALPELEGMAKLMGLRLFDVQVPCFECGKEADQEMVPLLMAAFKLDYVECFRWLMEAFALDQSVSDGAQSSFNELLELCVFGFASKTKPGSPKRQMMEIFMSSIIQCSHKADGTLNGRIHPGLVADPIFQAQLVRFRAEVSAAERAELAQVAPIPSDDEDLEIARAAESFVGAPCQNAPRSSNVRRLRI